MTLKILVTGATGNVGRAVVDCLVEMGAPVRAAVRPNELAHTPNLPAGVEITPFDLGDPTTFAPALAGVDRLFLMRPPAITDIEHTIKPFVETAACMGVRTSRVNMLTFGLGSGLAGLAGAFLSQIGNVGPSLGQTYIIDAFMTVVVGGVGHIMGTVASALGIGLLDQSLQQILGNPVMGKIMVLGGIILFLQWRPSGLFVTRSRSLD